MLILTPKTQLDFSYFLLIFRYKVEKEDDDKDAAKTAEDDQYLHPKLSTSIRPDLTPGTVMTQSKPEKDCAYSKLVHKIKVKQEQQKASVISAQAAATGLDSCESSPVPSFPSSPISTPATVPATSAVISSPAVLSTPEPISNKSSKKRRSTEYIKKGLVDYPSFNQTMDGSSCDEDEEKIFETPLKPTSTSTPANIDYSNIKWPPPDIQMVIDKMASYIIKNGPEFESVVRSRGKLGSYL